MKRTPLRRKTPLRSRPARHEPTAEREPKPMAAVTVAPLHRGVYGPAATTAAPKPEAKRNPALLRMAPKFGCLLRVPNVCEGDLEGIVACHSNLLIHGKGRGRKADDQYTAAGCQMCHSWLDQGKASAEEKEAVFMAAHSLQVLEWRRVAQDPREPERDRKAAQWALDELGAIP